MKNKRKKGFTLIELLAIIVILAIIAVITVPIILNVIDNARVGSIKDSAYGYKDAINKYYVSELYENLGFNLDGSYTITDKGRLSNETGVHEIPFTGTTPTGGYLTYKNNILTSGCITMDEYKVTVSDGEITTVEKGSCGEALNSKVITVVNQLEKGKIQIGDELAIDTEHFYVVSSDESNTVLLAKYNLLVGHVYERTNPYDFSYNKIRDIFETEEGYGLQSKVTIGTLAFASTNYWNGNVGEGLKYPGEYYGGDPSKEYNYPYVYDDNSNLYKYVELYKTKLQELGANIKEARLISDKELEFYVSNDNSKASGTEFWTGNALLSGKRVIAVLISGSKYALFDDIDSDWEYVAGVRPVIVVNTSDIEM